MPLAINIPTADNYIVISVVVHSQVGVLLKQSWPFLPVYILLHVKTSVHINY